MLSDIGGQLGLWVGVSVLTLVDFTETISNLIRSLYRRFKIKLFTKTRRLSSGGITARPRLDANYAIDSKSSYILSPSPSASIRLSQETLGNADSGRSARMPHVHFEDSLNTSVVN